MVVTYYNKLFRTGANRHNGILVSLLLLVAETISNASTNNETSAEVLYNLLNKLKCNHLKSIPHGSFYKICSKSILGVIILVIINKL